MFRPKLSEFLVFTILAVFAGDVSGADVTRLPGNKDGHLSGTVYKLTLSPAKEPVPALKNRLTVEPYKTIAGNAITHYLRSLGENSLNNPWDTAREQFGMDVHDWYSLETKAEDIPLDKLRIAAGYFDTYVEGHLRRATLCRDSDWGLAEEELSGKETFEFLLPSVQQTRSMARALMLRNRLAVIEGRFDDSVDQLRMTYQLGRNVNGMKFLVANLVGIAEVGMANEGLLDLIAAKDSPNMYWALAELPRPIISIRESLRLESSFGERYFPVLRDVETADYTKEKWTEHLSNLVDSLIHMQSWRGGQYGERSDELSGQSKLIALGAGLSGYSAAKQRLLDSGMDAGKVNQMAVAQVLLIDAARDCRVYSNDIEKTYYVPFEKSKELDDAAWANIQSQTPTRIGAQIVNTFSPAFGQVRIAEVRVQAQINVLMAIELIRNHIAMTGKLPARLEELKLPVPNDPFTNKPIGYEFNGESAVLSLSQSPRNYYSQRFEISIAPQE